MECFQKTHKAAKFLVFPVSIVSKSSYLLDILKIIKLYAQSNYVLTLETAFRMYLLIKNPNKLTEASIALPRPCNESVCSSPEVPASFEGQDQSAASYFHPDQFASSPPNTLQTKGPWVRASFGLEFSAEQHRVQEPPTLALMRLIGNVSDLGRFEPVSKA